MTDEVMVDGAMNECSAMKERGSGGQALEIMRWLFRISYGE